MRLVLGCLLLILSGCGNVYKKVPAVPTEKPITQANLDELQIDLIAQMEAFIEEIRADNKSTRASIRKVVGDCLCPSEMK